MFINHGSTLSRIAFGKLPTFRQADLFVWQGLGFKTLRFKGLGFHALASCHRKGARLCARKTDHTLSACPNRSCPRMCRPRESSRGGKKLKGLPGNGAAAQSLNLLMLYPKDSSVLGSPYSEQLPYGILCGVWKSSLRDYTP